MAGRLVTAMRAAETIIAALTPQDEPDITFRLAPAHLPLAQMPLSGSPASNTRRFNVRADTQSGVSLGGFQGATVDLEQVVVVSVLYHIPNTADVRGDERLSDLTGSDQALVSVALMRPPLDTQWGNYTINFTPAATRIERVSDDVFVQRLRYRVRYEHTVP